MPETVLARLGTVIVLAVCCLAVGLGTMRERIGAGIYLLACGLTIVAQQGFSETLPYALVGLDIICLLVFIMLCWKSAHPWPVWASLCQAISAMVHIAHAQQTSPTDGIVSQWAYYTVMALSGYGVLTALLIGTLNVARLKALQKRQNSQN